MDGVGEGDGVAAQIVDGKYLIWPFPTKERAYSAPYTSPDAKSTSANGARMVPCMAMLCSNREVVLWKFHHTTAPFEANEPLSPKGPMSTAPLSSAFTLISTWWQSGPTVRLKSFAAASNAAETSKIARKSLPPTKRSCPHITPTVPVDGMSRRVPDRDCRYAKRGPKSITAPCSFVPVPFTLTAVDSVAADAVP